jgi:hypothetical protein
VVELPLQLARHHGPLGVVAGVELRPVGRGIGAEAHDDRARPVLLDHAHHHVRAPQQPVDGVAVVVRDRLGQREEATEEERRGVDDEQRAGHG